VNVFVAEITCVVSPFGVSTRTRYAPCGVLESIATDGSLWLLVAASGTSDGNVASDAGRWTRELGRQFYIKRSNEAFETPTPNSFVLPDGRVIAIRSVLVQPQNFTCWGLSTLKTLPPNYIRI
jgi:hypothetical protein